MYFRASQDLLLFSSQIYDLWHIFLLLPSYTGYFHISSPKPIEYLSFQNAQDIPYPLLSFLPPVHLGPEFVLKNSSLQAFCR